MENLHNHLPFWDFFHQLENHLSYERWIDKYKLFLDQLYSNDYLLGDSSDTRKIFQLCRALYLQDIRHEEVFKKFFDAAMANEIDFLQTTIAQLRKQESKKSDTDDNITDTDPAPPVTPSAPTPSRQTVAKSGTSEQLQEQEEQVQEIEKTTKEYYYNPPEITVPKPVPAEERPPVRTSFNLHDEYLPVKRREMNKAWQYLRHSENGMQTDKIDIPLTIQKIAKESIFTTPVFTDGKRNREDTLIIFVDCFGSMVPFHELSRRLVVSAKTFGGHRKAKVYYFQNSPGAYVFERPNFTKPVKTVEAFSKTNQQFTTAVIVSDAGFARSYGNDKRYRARIASLEPFFKMLSAHCARTLWLNPMPENRWHKETAASIQQHVLKMAPLLERGMNTFQNTIRNLAKKQPGH